MRWTKRRFNPNSLRVEQVPLTRKELMWALSVRLFWLVVIGGGSVWLFDQVFQSPADRARDREIAFLEDQLEDMRRHVAQMDAALENLERRDDAVYRTILGVPPVPEHIRQAGVGGADRFSDVRGHLHSEEVADLKMRIAELQRALVTQSKSLDEVAEMAREYEDRLESIPAIQPVRNEDLHRMAGGWGYRIHPIYKVRKFHFGMDFSAPEGTEIFATGDGEVVKVKRLYNGYGRHVVIRHGFGYETLYAHMSSTDVKVGDRVHRGQVIGRVGSSGTSTSSHLHYEVHKDGVKVNPAHYFFNDLTPEEYEAMLEASEAETQSLD
ncbi:MAG: M23 family metallopeptidase [Bacteroidetes bacterium]|nr:M23 family metallopeptidase [Bacteroidota bacterium]MDA0903936.1 M23 family metallopeptidase [Bacteroidota bacterium]MDA1242782.1 M23 family metallopeptidase [Bacteroidota bacterium]